MGSYNLQCPLTKETISRGAKTVTLIVEPTGDTTKLGNIAVSPKSQGEHFQFASLPIKGTYEDFGRNIADANQKEVIEHIKNTFGGYDYTEKMGDKWGSKGLQLNRGEPASSYFDTNCFELTFLRSAYDIIISETENSDIVGAINNGDPLSVLHDAMAEDTIKNFEGIKHELLIEMGTFLKGLRNLGFSINHHVSLAASQAHYDFNTRIKLNHKPIGTNSSVITTERCMFTGYAINEGDIVYVIPVMFKEDLNRELKIANLDNYKSKARFTPVSAPIKATFKHGAPAEALSHDKLTTKINLLTTQDENALNEQTLLHHIWKEETETFGKKSKFFSPEVFQRRYALISEQAFELITSNKISKLADDKEVFVDSISELMRICESSADLDSLVASLTASELIQDTGAKTIKIMLDNQPYSPDRAKKAASFSLENYIEKDNSEKRWERMNIIMALIKSEHDLVVPHHVANALANGISAVWTASTSDDIEKNIRKYLDYIIPTLEINIKLLAGLSKYGVALMPMDKYLGELTISEQRELMHKIKLTGQAYVDAKLKERE